jgi:hypothetical protein
MLHETLISWPGRLVSELINHKFINVFDDTIEDLLSIVLGTFRKYPLKEVLE